MKSYVAICTSVFLLECLACFPGKANSAECIINLDTGKNTCEEIPAIEILHFNPGARGTRGKGEAVLAITLDGAVNPDGFTEASFKVKYTALPKGLTVHIGDSISNDGWNGDYGDQNHDAEMQIFKEFRNGENRYRTPNVMTIYGSDFRGYDIAATDPTPDYRFFTQTLRGIYPNITLKVKDGAFGWTQNNNSAELISRYLYALDGQMPCGPDNPLTPSGCRTEGDVNYTIYAGFNRVVYDGSVNQEHRHGKGVGRVFITLK
jgi:hypothetical protein